MLLKASPPSQRVEAQEKNSPLFDDSDPNSELLGSFTFSRQAAAGS
jgi:hypothetical protein